MIRPLYILVLLLALRGLPAQDSRVHLDHADHMRTIQLGDQSVRELEGNVVVRHQGRRITFQLGRYNRQTGMLYCVRDVHVEEAGRSLETDELVYDEIREILRARGNVHATGDSMESWAQHGEWQQGLSKGNLRVQAKVLDHANQLQLTAGEIDADHEAGVYVATRGPVLNVLKEPLTSLEANRITWNRPDSMAFAEGEVRLEREDFQADCDSLVWKDALGQVEFHQEPRLFREGREITGREIRALLRDRNELDSLLVEGKARMSSPSDSVSLLLKDVLEGHRLEMDFHEGSLNTVFVDGNARSVIFLKDEGGKPGMNVADAARMWFRMKESQLDEIQMGGRVNARWVPLSEPPGLETKVEDGYNTRTE